MLYLCTHVSINVLLLYPMHTRFSHAFVVRGFVTCSSRDTRRRKLLIPGRCKLFGTRGNKNERKGPEGDIKFSTFVLRL